MNLTTRCPSCGTAFRVQPAQLSARGGKVRCGKCGNVFDGVKALLAEGELKSEEAAALDNEPSPQLGLFEAPKKLSGAGDAANEDSPVPEFLEETVAPRRRVTWALGAVLAFFVLLAQSVYHFRTEIAVLVPDARPHLEAACAALKCELRLPRRPKLMAIESSDLQADGRRDSVIVLNAVLRNQAPFAQEYPSLELTLTDERDEAVARRVLGPADYLAGVAADVIVRGLGPGSDAVLRVYIDTTGLRAVGYRMYLFFHDLQGVPHLTTLVTGSMAYDTIMVFPDRFRNHLLADQLHILNVCFLTPQMRREFGGTAGNIGYNLKLLGDDPLLMATVGDDIDPYFSRLDKLGIGRKHLKRIGGEFTAQAFITTDLDDNQITAFHPGAMNHAQENRITAALGAKFATISPDGKEGMQQHARQCAEAGVPFVFDPGQGLPMFSGEELDEFIRLADYVAVNDYEAKLLEDKTGRKVEAIAKEVKAVVVTLGGKGSQIFTGGKCVDIPQVQAEAVVDPTGCGDAYRAGLLHGIASGWDWESTGRLGSLLGAIKIAQRGPQNHTFTRDEIATRYKKAFGASPF